MPARQKTSRPGAVVERLRLTAALPRPVAELLDAVFASGEPREALEALQADSRIAAPVFDLLSTDPDSNPRATTLAAYEPIRVLRAALAVSAREAFANPAQNVLDLRRHWRHAIAVAAGARFIAEKTGFRAPEEAFQAGLLHDVGRMVLNQYAPDTLAEVMRAISTATREAVLVERDTMGLDHSGAGEFVLRRWRFPERICRAVGMHHAATLSGEPDKDAAALAAAIQAADFIAWANGCGSGDHPPNMSFTGVMDLALKNLDQTAVYEAMASRLRAWGQFFGVTAPDSDELRRSLAHASAGAARLERARGELEARQERGARAQEAADLFRRRVRNAAERGDIPKALVYVLCRSLFFDRAACFEPDEETGVMRPAAALSSIPSKGDFAGTALPAPGVGESLESLFPDGRGLVLRSGGPGEDLLSRIGSAEAVFAPVYAAKRLVGLVVADNAGSHRKISESDVESVSLLVEETGLALENFLLLKHARRMKSMAETDSLTNLHNRRFLEHLLENEVGRAKRYQMPLSLVLMDLEGFKSFNDVYGHQAGDAVIKAFGVLLKKCSRTIDIPGRLGGDEFLVILPETGLEGAGLYAERVRKLTEELSARLAEEYSGCVFTVSVGMTSFNEQSDDAASFLHRADQAMYAAKQRGRNRVCAL